MIAHKISFDLPVPWEKVPFSTELIGAINFLVGPNGAGKSAFAGALSRILPNARLLGTDRLSGMEQQGGYRSMYGDNFAQGIGKNQFTNLKTLGRAGSGLDTLVLLEERLDLRMQVEATLSHLFDRKIMLDWDSGNLMPKVMLNRNGTSYRLDRDECHGIKELLVLLTHLYNFKHPYLIIDEPELNLHPQYQAFFMQEVRRLAGDPNVDSNKKIVFLITHSPFILDFRSAEDVKSIISFSLDHSAPRQILGMNDVATAKLASLVPRLNVHHKQLFFSDNPIFVEGILDAQLVATIQEARGVSVAGAGSCIIDAGGCEEVNKYLDLCLAFGKRAHFVYDLDSLFNGSLRACVRSDGAVESYLLTAGIGKDFGKYCGELDSKLTGLIDRIRAASPIAPALDRLIEFLNGLGPRSGWDGKRFANARVATLTAISRARSDVISMTSEAEVSDVEGRLKRIVTALLEVNVNLLPGGTLERYLPSYAGDYYELSDEAKRHAVNAEMEVLASPMSEADLAHRYGALYEIVRGLPSKQSVDVDRVLREYLSRFIIELQIALTNNAALQLDQLQAHLHSVQPASRGVFSVTEMQRGQHKEFTADVAVAGVLGQEPRVVHVTHRTNAGMQDFEILFAASQPTPNTAAAPLQIVTA